RDRATARVDDAADDADQRRLAGAVGPKQREDLALSDLQADVLQRLETRCVGLGEVGNAENRLHGIAGKNGGETHRTDPIESQAVSNARPCSGRSFGKGLSLPQLSYFQGFTASTGGAYGHVSTGDDATLRDRSCRLVTCRD